MKSSKYKNPIPFFQRSRKSRNLSYIQMKNKISEEHAKKGRNFYSYHIINEKDIENVDLEKHKSAWVDLYFLSRKHKFFYNVELITKDMAALDAIKEYCYKQREHISFPSNIGHKEISESGMITTKLSQEYLDYMAKVKEIDLQTVEKMYETHKVIVRDITRLDYTYSHGVGLHAVVDTDNLTEGVIMKWINDFLDNGECISNGKEIPYSVERLKRIQTREHYML